MIDLTTEIEAIQSRIGQADPDTRYEHEPELRHIIDRMRAAGLSVPSRAIQLHGILLSEVIEAEFDNMPV